MVFFRAFGCGAAFMALLSTALMAGQLSPLAPAPDWATLEPYQKTITRADFTRLVNQVYSPDGSFWNYLQISDEKVIVYSDTKKTELLFTLEFAASDAACQPLPHPVQTKATSTDPSRPLKGIRIALDPGHIGGDWAQLEARYFKLGDDPSVEEAKLNLTTCKILAELLEADGAEIIWAKKGYEPTTNLRPDDLHREAIAALSPPAGKGSASAMMVFGLPVPSLTKNRSGHEIVQSRVDNEAALLFYRVAEIRARAEVVNKQHPDLTICVHYNADDWGDPDHPRLTGSSRLIIFINGAYGDKEIPFDDTKFDLLRKLLDRSAALEEKGCALVGQEMLNTLKYPPETYGDHVPGFLKHVTDVPSVYARNLLANRLYHGPVIYCEGPYMNARDAYYRIIAGDYLGVRTIQGQSVPSVYRDYAGSVERGVLKYFGAVKG